MTSGRRFAPDKLTVVLSAVDEPGREPARARALRAAATVLEAPPEQLRLDHAPSGRPMLSGIGERLHISVSHTRGLVAVALTGLGPVGVDIEAVRPLGAVRLSRRWFPAEEAEWVARQPALHRDRAFLWLWTHKEAIGKARGLGLREGGLRCVVPVPASWPEPALGDVRLTPVARDADVAVAAVPTPPDLVMAVAASVMAATGVAVDVRIPPGIGRAR